MSRKNLSKRGKKTDQNRAVLAELETSIQKAQAYEKACSLLSESKSSGSSSPVKRMAKKGTVGTDELAQTQFSYKYSDDRQIRGRRYVCGAGAQSCAQRLQYHLFPHTVDLDISNCCLSLVLQLLEKAAPEPSLPDEACAALKQWLESREKVCESFLHVPVPEGKQIVNKVINGGAPPEHLKRCDFIAKLQIASAYLRWFACSLLPGEYKDLEDREDKNFPSATIFHYCWTAVEDYILEHWCFFLESMSPSHLSLHFDGVRVNADIHENISELRSSCEKHILASTGFQVEVKQKKHELILELIKQTATSCAENSSVPDCFLQKGNCIPCALWHLCASRECFVAVMGEDCVENKYHQERGCRTYDQCSCLFKVKLMPCMIADLKEKQFLLHCENGGMAHCVAVEWKENGSSATISDGRMIYSCTRQALITAIASGIDNSTVVCFELAGAGPARGTGFANLMELQAGSGSIVCESEDEDVNV